MCYSSERPGPGAAAGGVRPAQMHSSAASFAEISPEVILGDGVGNSAFLFDMEHFYYKTAWSWKVKVVCSYRWGAKFPKCPQCGITMEHEYQLFRDRCGQKLNWSGLDDVEVRYIGWDFHFKLYRADRAYFIASIMSLIPTFRPSSKAVFSHAQHTAPCRSMIFSQSGILSPT